MTAAVRATVSEDDETEALDLVYAWLGGDRAARTLLTRPEYDALTANIAQALADRSAEAEARVQAAANQRAVEELEAEAAYDDAAPEEQYARGLFARRLRVRAENLRAAVASPAPAPQTGEGQR